MLEFSGLVALPWWGYVLVTLGLTHVTIVCVTVFLHRHQAHQALDMHPAVSHFFRFWLWLTTSMSTRAWVAVHRKHHDKVEGPEDPHSPAQFGINKVLWQGSELYSQEAVCAETLKKYGKGTPDDWLERRVYARHGNYGIGTMLIVDLLLFGPIGLTIWAVQMLWIPFFAAGVINGLGHWFGYRNFNTRDRSTNLLPLAILIGGEELHNNHHAYSSSARMSAKWWEFDAGWMYIRLLEILGLAWVDQRKLAPWPHIDLGKQVPDLDTVSAILKSHVHVMSEYARRVVDRVCREELKQAPTPRRRTRARRISKLLRAQRLGRTGHRLLGAHPTLGSVYRLRQDLASLLRGQTNGEVALGKLRRWCDEAERSGIDALNEFAVKLKGYTLKPSL